MHLEDLHACSSTSRKCTSSCSTAKLRKPSCHPNPLQPACSTSPLSSTGIRQATAAAANNNSAAGPPPSLSSSTLRRHGACRAGPQTTPPPCRWPPSCPPSTVQTSASSHPTFHPTHRPQTPSPSSSPPTSPHSSFDPPSYVYAPSSPGHGHLHSPRFTDRPQLNADDSTLQPNRNVKISCTTPRTSSSALAHPDVASTSSTIIVGYSSRRGRYDA
ncbi:hypothetical protein DFP72DRAFT_273705 [Ephemerocybe angulata]|uniref:Uncharacterized protein n=1 Tax=Ephemerocybe angulata TaxID=980116 RepID=A0A8H6I0J0_9AGAR|nr:hypothetical protein DFP72DRAFT_273705 [Tulosesus angulatus]